MANTYTSLHYHLIFSTKNRVSYIKPEIEQRVWADIGGIARKHGMTALPVGGTDDHIHVLVMTPPTLAPSQIAQFLKGDSSKWIHEEFSALRDFAWQDGYGAFTVSKSNLPEVIRYIQHQREHHQKRTFQKEYLEFLRKSIIPFVVQTRQRPTQFIKPCGARACRKAPTLFWERCVRSPTDCREPQCLTLLSLSIPSIGTMRDSFP